MKKSFDPFLRVLIKSDAQRDPMAITLEDLDMVTNEQKTKAVKPVRRRVVQAA